MLVYANTFWIKTPENNLGSVISSVDEWLAKKTSRSLSARNSINAGPKRGVNGHEIDAMVSGEAEDSEYVLASIIYSHPDPQVSGRKWFTRIGARLFPKAGNTQISVVVETSDISVQSGSATVTATRPAVVNYIIRHCGLLDDYPSEYVEHLSIDNVNQFIAEVETPSRKHAIILISPDSFSELLLVDPLEILDQVVGLGKVFSIDNKNSGKELSLILGRRRSAWDGAVNIIYPPLQSGFTPTHLLSSNEIKRIEREEASFSRHLLYLLTHRLNLRNYREEIASSTTNPSLKTGLLTSSCSFLPLA